jgi:hypothetical protein
VIGIMTYKMEKESFWLTPTQLCENELMGEIFDEIFDGNMIRLSDMQEKAIKFMKDEQQMDSSQDFIFFMKSQK